MDVDADISLSAAERLSGMQPHPDADARAARPVVMQEGALGRDRSSDGIPGAREHDEERVPLRIHLPSSRFCEGRTQ